MRRRLCLIALSLVLAAPGVAVAQDDGVFVDPDSPTGKEYAIPLEEARRQASGGGDAPARQGERTAPLFGEGIEEPTPEDDASGSPGSGSGGNREGSGGASSGSSGGRSSPSSSEPSGTGSTQRSGEGLAVTPASSGFSSTPAVAGLAVAVLLLGGVLGSVLRRRPLA